MPHVTDELVAPVVIAPNLQAGVRVGGGWITVGYSKQPGDGTRVRYRWEIIFPDGSDESADDLQSGCGGGNLTAGLESLLAFLAAAAESFPDGENADSFPPRVCEFAKQHADEISILQCELEEKINAAAVAAIMPRLGARTKRSI